MALVMAVALWLYAINRQTEDVTEVVKLNVSVPEGITVLEQSFEEITVHLRGPQSIIESVEDMIKDRKIQARYVVKESPEGIEDQVKQTIPITRAHMNLPSAVKLVSVYPDRVDVMGPLNTLIEASFINTIPVDISGITSEQNRTFPWRLVIDHKVIVKRA